MDNSDLCIPAVRPWDTADSRFFDLCAAESGRGYGKNTMERARQMAERCADCQWSDECHYPRCEGPNKAAARTTQTKRGRAKKARKIYPVTADPCVACRSKPLCIAIGGTCGDKTRWEEINR